MPGTNDTQLRQQLNIRRAALTKLQSQLGGKESQKRQLEAKLSFPGRFDEKEKAEAVRKYNSLRDDIADLEKRISRVKADIRSLESQLYT